MAIVNDFDNQDEQAFALCENKIKRISGQISHIEKNHRKGLDCDEARELEKWRSLYTYMQTKF